MHMNLPQNPKPNFSDIVFDFTCNASVFDPFSYIFGFKSLFHMFVCLFALHMLELGFILFFFTCFDAMNMHSHVHACMP